MTDHPLHIGFHEDGSEFRLPLDLVTTTLAILAKKGRGKSYLAAVIAEELMLNHQIPVIIDPTGAHFGIKSSADGLKEGFSVVVFGGRHADLPLDEHNGEVIAQAIVEQRFPAILDVSQLRKGAANRFLGAFFETMYRLNEEPLHIIADEADLYAPQRAFGDQMRTLGAVEDIVRRGRVRGLGCTLVTQRPQVLSKDVLTQAEMLVTLGMSHPKDMSAIKEWIDVHATVEESRAMMVSLPTMPVGSAWFWAPGWGDVFDQVNVRQRITFNSGQTPKAGKTLTPPKVIASIDLAALGEKLKVVADQVRDNDPAKLRKEVQALREDNRLLLGYKEKADLLEEQLSTYQNAARAAIEEEVAAGLIFDVDQLLKKLRALPTRASQAPKISIPHPEERVAKFVEDRAPKILKEPELVGVARNTTLTPVARKFLTVLAQRRPKLTERNQLAVLAGYSARSGHVDNTLSSSRTRGLIIGDNNNLQITPEGVKILGKWTPLPRGAALVEYWISHLNPAEGKMLRVIVDAYPRTLTRQEVATSAGYSPSSGHVDNSLGRLRTMDLVRGGNSAISASDDLF